MSHSHESVRVRDYKYMSLRLAARTCSPEPRAFARVCSGCSRSSLHCVYISAYTRTCMYTRTYSVSRLATASSSSSLPSSHTAPPPVHLHLRLHCRSMSVIVARSLLYAALSSTLAVYTGQSRLVVKFVSSLSCIFIVHPIISPQHCKYQFIRKSFQLYILV